MKLKIKRRIYLVIGIIVSILTLLTMLINTKNLTVAVVLSDSMKPTFSSGDLLVLSGNRNSEIKVGDVITFQGVDNIPITHRVVDFKGDLVITKGDAVSLLNTEEIYAENINSIYITHIPYAGFLISWIASPFGFFFFYLIPMVYIFYVVLRRIFFPRKTYKRYRPREI